MLQNDSSEERGDKKYILVRDFRKMFTRQIPKEQLHRRRLQSKGRKNLKIGAKR